MIINGFYVITNVTSYALTNLHQTELCDVDGSENLTYMNLRSFKLNRVYVVSSNVAGFLLELKSSNKLYSSLKREKRNSSSCTVNKNKINLKRITVNSL